MSYNSFGRRLKITTFGESHGEAMGVIIDGTPSNIEITKEYIQNLLKERQPAQSKFTTQRKELDEVEILSGVYQGKTLGTPISLIIKNRDSKSSDYENLIEVFRPSHADYTWYKKFKHRDQRGGGRSSARETVARVAGSAVAYKILESHGVIIHGFISSIKGEYINYANINYEEIKNNVFYSADSGIINSWTEILEKAIQEGDSVGATIDIHIKNCPIGLGEPVFEKLNANLAKALFSIPAVKGLEFGAGFNMSHSTGSKMNDGMIVENNQVKFLSNNNGGILGGISTGEDIIMKIAIKPTSSISMEQQTINSKLENISLQIRGRHDPCIAIRAVSVCKAMCALVLADFLLS